MDWVGDINEDSGRPPWIRQVGFMPCNCGKIKCFFCKTGKTTGIVHKPKREIKLATVPRGHAKKREPVCKTTKMCGICYDQLDGQNLNSAEKKKLYVRTNKGCRMCRKVCCAEHWHAFCHVVTSDD